MSSHGGLSMSLLVAPFFFCALPRRGIQITTSLLGPLVAWWDTGGSCHGQRDAALDQSATTPQGCRWTGTAGLGQPQNSSQCCSAPANMRNTMRNPGHWTKIAGVSALCGQQQPGMLQNPHLSVHLGLVSRGRWPPSHQTRWMCSPFQTGHAPLTGFAALECRFPLLSFPYLVLANKVICFVYPYKCQKCKILKSLPKNLLSFKKRAIEIVILLSYCLMNLLTPPFSAQKWVLSCLKQGEFFAFICCSISSYQSRG